MVKLSRQHFRALRLTAFAMLLTAVAAAAPAVSSLRVVTDPIGAIYQVDGVRYTAPSSFLWPAGTKHELSVLPVQTATQINGIYTFSGWADASGSLRSNSPVVNVIADPSIKEITASFRTQYAMSLVFFKCPSLDPGACLSPGTVLVNGIAYNATTKLYLDKDSVVDLSAVPNPGYLFAGWRQGTGNAVQSSLNTIHMDQARSIYPVFERAGYMTLETSPPGFQVVADHTLVAAPAGLEWGLNTPHTVGVVSPQTDRQGRKWAFESWSDGGSQSHAVTMPKSLQAGTQKLVARFVLGAPVTMLTSPPGLKLTVDGRQNWPGYNFLWVPGSLHTVEASGRQTDAQGRTWIFSRWSNGGAASQEFAAPADTETGMRLTAIYEPMARVTVQTSLSGVQVEADGQPCAAPCVLERSVGATLHLRAPSYVAAADGVRLDFIGWSDGASAERELTLGADPLVLTANYRQRYLLALSTDPAGAARFQLDPASPDSYYDVDQTVSLTMQPNDGFKFQGWEGDLTGLSKTAVFAMSAPHRARAMFEAVPYVPPDGVRNAAGPTPDPVVAPGSIVSIYGAHLTGETVVGPQSPLTQTLGGVLARTGDRMLPLFFVSPEQINALLPADLADGEHELVIERDGQPDASVKFTSARNAPGLFGVPRDDLRYQLALHEDGSLVSLEKPARRGETITLFGTGFGPYQRKPPEGFAVPAKPEYPLVDPVEILQGDAVLTPAFAGAAAGFIGMDAVRLTIPENSPVGSLEIKARVNGRESNTVLLPVETQPPAPATENAAPQEDAAPSGQ